MRHYIFITAILFCSFISAFSQTTPKRELRGVWISSVSNLDWPSSKTASVATQQKELREMLNTLKNAGINTVFLQVRPSSDALYQSTLEPWSEWLTGTQGTAPSPLWDPLSFAITEAHARGMELHAWINPFRAVVSTSSSSVHSSHISVTQPSYILTFGTKKFLDPGQQVVRNYVESVIMDIVNRYDVDGIHFDDYFYPYPETGISFNDATTFANEPRGFSNIDDWRRDNVNIFVQQIKNAIVAAKPHVRFGISPFGIWKTGTPSGISGMSAYSAIWCDAVAWLTAQSVDYVMPQLYWQIGGAQDYNSLLTWWITQRNSRDVFSGNGAYRLEPTSSDWAATEIGNQLRYNRTTTPTSGMSLFRAEQITANTKSIFDTLKNRVFNYNTINPALTWRNAVAPNAPTGLAATANAGRVSLSWSAPTAASDGDDARWYVVYRSLSSGVDVTAASSIVGRVYGSATSFVDSTSSSSTTYYYKVSALDKYLNESAASSEVQYTGTIVTLDDFEASAGRFTSNPTVSGSTAGLSTSSTTSRTTTEAYGGTGSLRIILIDNTSLPDNWTARILSGGGSPASNYQMGTTGYIGFWMKTTTAPPNAQAYVFIDENLTSAIEKSPAISVDNSGAWTLYQYNLAGSGWTAFTGNGVINGPITTLDAIYITGNNTATTCTLFVDNVSYDVAAPLPVELLAFSGSLSDINNIELQWSTATEINSFAFEIEKTDGLNGGSGWKTIALIPAAGNSNSPKQYVFTDNNPVHGKQYYRLKMIDTDGSFEYSHTVEVNNNATPVQYALEQNYPNPFNPNTTILYQLPAESKVTLSVYNVLGEQVSTLVDEVKTAGVHFVDFNASALPSGMYVYRLQAGEFTSVRKMVITK